jgi:hypothetical protein
MPRLLKGDCSMPCPVRLTFAFVRCLAADGFVAWLACRWRSATQLSGASPDDEVVAAFWAAIGELTQDERGMVRHVSSASC